MLTTEKKHPPLLQSSLASPTFFFPASRVSALRAAALAFRACDPLVLFVFRFAAVSLSFTLAFGGGWASLSRSYLSESYGPCHYKEGTSEGRTPT